MTATAEQIARVRRMVAEPTEATYNDASIAGYIERYPLLDERGQAPYTWDASTIPPTKTANTAWIATYDLHAAAAEIWGEKAASQAGLFDHEADGGSFKRSQAYEHAMGQQRYHNARRSPKTATLQQWPKETNADTFPWIGNLPEPRDP
jgi:hypothetical protein